MDEAQFWSRLNKKHYAMDHQYGAVHQEEGDMESESQRRYVRKHKKIKENDEQLGRKDRKKA